MLRIYFVCNRWNWEFRTTLRLPFAHTSLKSVVDIGPISLNKTITLLGAERFANPANNHRVDIKNLVNNRKKPPTSNGDRRISSINSINVDVQQGGKVLFVKQTIPLTIVSPNPTREENQALEPIVKGNVAVFLRQMLPFSSLLKIKSQVLFCFKSRFACKYELDSFALEWKKIKSRSSEMNTFSRKPTLPKSNIAPKK